MKIPLQLVLLFSVLITQLGIGITVPVIPDYAIELGASGTSLGFMIAVFSLVRCLFQPIVGVLSDRFGRREFLFFGLSIYGLGGLLMPMARSITDLTMIRAVQGIGAAIILPISMAYVSGWAPPGKEGRCMALLNTAIFCGIGGGPILGGFLADIGGKSLAFYSMSFLSFSALFLLIGKLPQSNELDKILTKNLDVNRSFSRMFSARRVKAILLARMATMFIMVPTISFFPLYASQKLDASCMMIGLIITGRTLANAILQLPCGKIADQYDKITLLTIGCFIAGTALMIIPLAADIVQLIIIFIIIGMAESLVWTVLGAFASEEGKYYGHGTIMGAFNLAMSGGTLLGSLFGGLIMELYGLNFIFVFIGVMGLILGLISIILLRGTSPRLVVVS
ncbi:MAG: MFS transporter [Desulfobulbaceae bacterium]|nr:MFS transporter [Desulfobulbaceae bacterium]